MASLDISDEFVAMAELHCIDYRMRYGHLRTDGKQYDAPIGNPNLSLPGHLTIRASHDHSLRFWLECERMLWMRRQLPMGSIRSDIVMVGCDPGRSPAFSSQVFARPRVDRSGHIPSLTARPREPSRISIILNGLYKQFETWPMREVIDRDSAFVASRTSTDYPKRKGWLPIPHRLANPASPSARLLALLARS